MGDAALTGWTALWVYGLLESLASELHLLVHHGRRNRVRKHERIRVLRTRHFADADLRLIRGLVTVSPAWAITDLARSANIPMLRPVVIDAVQRGLATQREIEEVLDLRGPIPGGARLRQVLREVDEEKCDSMLEYHIRRRVHSDPWLTPPAKEPVKVVATDGRSVKVDVGWTERYVGLECLGMAYHADRSQLDTDALRSNALAGTPWTILLATWRHHDDDEAWATLSAQIRRLLDRS